MKNWIYAILLIFGAASLEPAFACSCTPPKDPVKVSKAVFFGQLVEKVQPRPGADIAVKFKVERYWKGEVSEEESLVTTGGACLYNFRVGEKYLIYALENETGRLEAVICRIWHESIADKELKKLGEGKTPEPRRPVSSSAPPNNGMQRTRTQPPSHLPRSVRAADARR